MKKLIILACSLSLLVVAGLAWSQSTTTAPQQPPSSNYNGLGMMGPGGGSRLRHGVRHDGP